MIIRLRRRTLLQYLCPWCDPRRPRKYAHAFVPWRGSPTIDSHGICMECSLVVLRQAQRETRP